jgi:hypothetical protein
VAGTADDANNLSIIMTARELKPSLITVARQNHASNQAVFAAAAIDMVMEPREIIANHILGLLKTPLLMDFLNRLESCDEVFCESLMQELTYCAGDAPIDSWSFRLNLKDAPAIHDWLRFDRPVTVADLCRDPRDRSLPLGCKVLMIQRDGDCELSPPADRLLRIEDQLLMGGLRSALWRQDWITKNPHVMQYVMTGSAPGGGAIWRYFSRKAA